VYCLLQALVNEITRRLIFEIVSTTYSSSSLLTFSTPQAFGLGCPLWPREDLTLKRRGAKAIAGRAAGLNVALTRDSRGFS
jgi:hypothetical protein